MNDEAASIMAQAQTRKNENDLPYAGALTPKESAALLAADTNARLVDVRTAPELSYVGRVPGAAAVEWQSWPDMSINANFLEELEKVADKESPVLFLCRSGVRSHHAAAAAAQAGWRAAINVLEGFEGGINEDGKRGFNGGWRFHGLPWRQS